MDLNIVSIVIAVIALLLAAYAVFRRPLQTVTANAQPRFETAPLQLQAYERLVLLAERIALPHLISRLNQPGISAFEMKVILNENIKHEFEYNSTQQLYVSPAAWDAVRNLKEQNIMIVNQVAAALPAAASANDLNKKILELIMSQPNGALHELVTQVLNHEAKKIM